MRNKIFLLSSLSNQKEIKRNTIFIWVFQLITYVFSYIKVYFFVVMMNMRSPKIKATEASGGETDFQLECGIHMTDNTDGYPR